MEPDAGPALDSRSSTSGRLRCYRSHDERFLKLYCRNHNRLSAERHFGAEFIERKIAAARR